MKFENLEFSLNDKQYRNFLTILSYTTNFSKFSQYRKFRPIKANKKENGKEWLKYLIKTRLIEKRKKLFDFEYYQKKKELYFKKYIKLYKKFVQVPWLTPMSKEEENLFKILETSLKIEDIKLFRKISEAEITEEEKQHKIWNMKQQLKLQNQKKTSWFSFGGDKNIINLPQEGTIELDDETKNELYKAIGYNEEDENLTFENNNDKNKNNDEKNLIEKNTINIIKMRLKFNIKKGFYFYLIKK
jgi:hypothetical protein